MTVQNKHPSDDIDYSETWSNIGSATLSSVTHTVPSGLTKVSESNTTTTSMCRLSGGTHGKTYVVTATATLSTGRTLVRTRSIRVGSNTT